MSCSDKTKVLAIGIDAAEPGYLRQLINDGAMPVLKSLLGRGQWLTVQSPAKIGSGAVWPSLITGEEPAEHGVYGEWCWQPETMSLARYNGRGLTPFWQKLVDAGVSVGVLDVPFARLIGLHKGFEITEWGAHDCLEGLMDAGPSQISDVINQHPKHPLSVDRLDVGGPHDFDALKDLSAGCLRGVQLRGSLGKQLLTEIHPEFALVVFTEIHHAAHHLWHIVDPEHEIYNSNGSFKSTQKIRPGLDTIYREVDRQIGELISVVSEDSRVMVFSLHGMQATHGIPAFLGPMLCEAGFAKLATWGTKSWKDRARGVFEATKRRAPGFIKKLYYKSVSPRTAHLLAQTTMLPSYDWSQTRAIALPSDQHGWIRINLSGREAQGCVEQDQYEGLCRQLEDLLMGLTDEAGRSLVRRVTRTSASVQAALTSRLPDLIAHWENAAFAEPLRVKGFNLRSEAIGTKFTGQHALEGFCILRSVEKVVAGDVLPATKIGEVLTRMVSNAKLTTEREDAWRFARKSPIARPRSMVTSQVGKGDLPPL